MVNRLINTGLIEDRGEKLVLLKKGLNVLSFYGEKDRSEAEIAAKIAVK